jgi:hypothetical protein
MISGDRWYVCVCGYTYAQVQIRIRVFRSQRSGEQYMHEMTKDILESRLTEQELGVGTQIPYTRWWQVLLCGTAIICVHLGKISSLRIPGVLGREKADVIVSWANTCDCGARQTIAVSRPTIRLLARRIATAGMVLYEILRLIEADMLDRGRAISVDLSMSDTQCSHVGMELRSAGSSGT